MILDAAIFFSLKMFQVELYTKGDSYLNDFLNFASGIPTSCSILFTDFRTVFIFALGRFVLVVVNIHDLQCKCTIGRLNVAEKNHF